MPSSWDGSWNAAGGDNSGDNSGHAEGAGAGNAGDSSPGAENRKTSSSRRRGCFRKDVDCKIAPSFDHFQDTEEDT